MYTRGSIVSHASFSGLHDMFAISADRRTRVESGYRWQAHQIRLPYCARVSITTMEKASCIGGPGTCATIAGSDNHRRYSRAFARHESIGIGGPLCAESTVPRMPLVDANNASERFRRVAS